MDVSYRANCKLKQCGEGRLRHLACFKLQGWNSLALFMIQFSVILVHGGVECFGTLQFKKYHNNNGQVAVHFNLKIHITNITCTVY